MVEEQENSTESERDIKEAETNEKTAKVGERKSSSPFVKIKLIEQPSSDSVMSRSSAQSSLHSDSPNKVKNILIEHYFHDKTLFS